MSVNIKSWLRRLPQPAKLRLDKKTVVRVGEGKNKWRDCIDTILAQQPHILEALDGDGEVIRTTELTAEGDQDDSPPAPKDGPNTELAQLGALLKEAYVDGAKAHADAYQKLLAEHVKLMQLVVDRNLRLEERAEESWEEKAAQIAAGNGDLAEIMNGPLGVLINAVMGRMLETKKPEPAADKNGKRARK